MRSTEKPWDRSRKLLVMISKRVTRTDLRVVVRDKRVDCTGLEACAASAWFQRPTKVLKKPLLWNCFAKARSPIQKQRERSV